MAMVRWYPILFLSCLLCLAGCGDDKDIRGRGENREEEVMASAIHIDPEVDMKSEKMVEIIIHFKTKPAKVAVAIAEMSGVPLSLDQAKQDVEDSHSRFQEDIERYLGQNQIPYSIMHIYKAAFNGVAMKLPGKEIKRLLQSNEIATIYANKEIKLIPPPKPK